MTASLAKAADWQARGAEFPTLDARLMIWLSPAFPIGSFAYSHGLEKAVECGYVNDRASLHDWLSDTIALGTLRNDLIVHAEAWRAAVSGDLSRLLECNTIALAQQPSAERHLETVTQGYAFIAAIRSVWAGSMLEKFANASAPEIAYPVAVGATSASHAIELEGSALGYGISFVTNLCSAAIRLSVIGQTDAQRVISGLAPVLIALAKRATNFTLDDLGSATFSADLCSLAHETQFTRLFRS